MCGFVGFSSANAELDKVKIINDMMKIGRASCRERV